MSIAPLDIIFLVIVGFSAIRTAMRGFVAEVMSFAAVVGGVAAAVLLSGKVTAYIGAHYGESIWNKVIAFLGIFLLCYLVIKIFERGIYRVIDGINLEKLDRALGFFLGVAEGLLVVVLIVFILRVQPFFKLGSALHSSRAAGIIMQLFPVQTSTLPPPLGGTSV